MRTVLLLLALALPGALSGQEGYVGLLGGMTTARLPHDVNHHGSMAGAFLQVDISPHVGFRSEASWARTGAMAQMDPNSFMDTSPSYESLRKPQAVDLDFAEVNAQVRLSWATSELQPTGAHLGLAVFGGGWLGARIHGRVAEDGNRVADFGHLLGLGFFWTYQRILLEVDARAYHGERGLTEDGPKRRGSQLVFGLGYRVH
jgi:hypothetical protein